MFHAEEPEYIQRLIELADDIGARVTPIHIKEDYEPKAYCGEALTPSHYWELNRSWRFATCQSCIAEDASRNTSQQMTQEER